MKRQNLVIFIFAIVVWLSGCASVPMAPQAEDKARKAFGPPSQGMAGLYIFRDSSFGGALLKSIYIDGKFLGESGPNVYFYTELKPGQHILSTESEFSENHLKLTMQDDQNYFVRQYIKFGVFVGGADFEVVSPEKGMVAVKKCELALPGKSQSDTQPDHIEIPQ